MSELTDMLGGSSDLFKEIARRKRALGIVERRWSVRFDTAALQSMDEYWHTFCATLGKERATDYLIVLMRYGYEKLEQVSKEKGKKKCTGRKS